MPRSTEIPISESDVDAILEQLRGHLLGLKSLPQVLTVKIGRVCSNCQEKYDAQIDYQKFAEPGLCLNCGASAYGIRLASNRR